MDLLDVAGELYALTPQEFTAARDDHARQARAAREKEVAQQVRRLSRPTAAAWVVNTLARSDSALLDELLALGAALREAQDGAAGEHVRLLAARRRERLAATLARARSLAQQHGHPVSRATADEVEATLRAAVADATAARAVRSGRLTRALAASGLGAVDVSAAVAVPDSLPPAPAPLRLVTDPSERPASARRRPEPDQPEPVRPEPEPEQPEPEHDVAERTRTERSRAARDDRRALKSLRQAAAAAATLRDTAAEAEAAAVARSEDLRDRLRTTRRELHDLEQQAAAAVAAARAAREGHRRATRDARTAERAVARVVAAGRAGAGDA